MSTLEYERPPGKPPAQPPVGVMGALSVTTWLIVINIAVYILDHILAGRGLGYVLSVPGQPPRTFLFLEWWGHFSIQKAIYDLQLWRMITFQFLHDPRTIGHIAFNMFALYFFGPLIEGYLG